jgi:hypothetical protein
MHARTPLFTLAVLVMLGARPALAADDESCEGWDGAPKGPRTPSVTHPGDGDDLTRFRSFVAHADTPSRVGRYVGALAGLGVSAVVTPVGAVLYGRDANAGSGVVLGTGIGFGVGGLLELIFASKSPYASADAAAALALAQGRTSAQALAAGEAVLEQAAREARTERLVGGIIGLGLGAGALGVGAVFAGADLTSSSFSRKEQDGVATALMLAGAWVTACGAEILFSPTPLETSWAAYHAGRSREPRRSALLLPAVTPTPNGGAMLTLGGALP